MDLIGKKFGRLVVKKEGRKRKGKRCFLCRCTCARKTWVLVIMDSLRNSHTRSCGCLRAEKAKSINFKHGLSNSKAYRAWINVEQRCNNPKALPQYTRYGAKNIRMSTRWNNFMVFLQDMGNPAEGRSLDRLDSRGDYSAQNCHWATAKQQQKNQTCKSFLFPRWVHYVSKSGKVERKKVNQAKMMREIGAVMTPAQTGICDCGRRCFYDDKFCGRAECDNDGTKWKPFVESKTPKPINIWKP
jgi:hypothetical protein